MRLIDADELKKYISKMPLTNASKEMFKNAINAQPTAYVTDSIKDTELFREIFLDKLRQKAIDMEESLTLINICTMAWNEFLEQMQKGTENE